MLRWRSERLASLLTTTATATVVAVCAATLLTPASPASASWDPNPPVNMDESLVYLSTPGASVLDLSADQLLLSDWYTPRLSIYNRLDGTSTDLPEPPAGSVLDGWLVPSGVVLRIESEADQPRLYAWTGAGAFDDLGPVQSYGVVIVRGSYVIWSHEEGTLYRRDLTTGVTVTVATTASPGSASWGLGPAGSVAANGDVVYASAATGSRQIYRYRDGVTTQLTHDEGDHTDPATDGVNVVYSKSGDGLWLIDAASNQTRLVAGNASSPNGGFAVAGGWVAWVGADANEQGPVWLRSPAGVITQVGAGLSNADIFELSETGQVAWLTDNAIYVGGAVPTRLLLITRPWDYWGSHTYDWYLPSYVVTLGDRWHVVWSGSVYVESDQAPVDLAVSVDGQGSVGIEPYSKGCDDSCTYSLPPGAHLTLTAKPASWLWQFAGWTGLCADTEQTCTVTLAAAASVQARFTRLQTPEVTVPRATLAVGASLSSTVPAEVPMHIAWTATGAGGGELVSDELEVAVNREEFVPVPLDGVLAQEAQFRVIVGNRYQFRARATDDRGMVGEWSYGPEFVVTARLDEPSATDFQVYGSVLGVVAATGPGFGDVDVYVDDHLVATFATASDSARSGVIVGAVPLGCTCHAVRVVKAPSSTGTVAVAGVIVVTE